MERWDWPGLVKLGLPGAYLHTGRQLLGWRRDSRLRARFGSGLRGRRRPHAAPDRRGERRGAENRGDPAIMSRQLAPPLGIGNLKQPPPAWHAPHRATEAAAQADGHTAPVDTPCAVGRISHYGESRLS